MCKWVLKVLSGKSECCIFTCSMWETNTRWHEGCQKPNIWRVYSQVLVLLQIPSLSFVLCMTPTHTFTHLRSVDCHHTVTGDVGLVARKLLIWFSAKNHLLAGEGIYSFTTMTTSRLNSHIMTVACWLTNLQSFYPDRPVHHLKFKEPSKIRYKQYLLNVFHTLGEKGNVIQHQFNPVKDTVAHNYFHHTRVVTSHQRGKRDELDNNLCSMEVSIVLNKCIEHFIDRLLYAR